MFSNRSVRLYIYKCFIELLLEHNPINVTRRRAEFLGVNFTISNTFVLLH